MKLIFWFRGRPEEPQLRAGKELSTVASVVAVSLECSELRLLKAALPSRSPACTEGILCARHSLHEGRLTAAEEVGTLGRVLTVSSVVCVDPN